MQACEPMELILNKQISLPEQPPYLTEHDSTGMGRVVDVVEVVVVVVVVEVDGNTQPTYIESTHPGIG